MHKKDGNYVVVGQKVRLEGIDVYTYSYSVCLNSVFVRFVSAFEIEMVEICMMPFDVVLRWSLSNKKMIDGNPIIRASNSHELLCRIGLRIK